MVGLRTGCRGHLATSHNHGGAYYLLKQDENGLYNTPADKVPGNETTYTGIPDDMNDESIRAGQGRYDAGSIPIYSNKNSGVGELKTGPDDGYGGIAIYDKGDGTYDYLVTSSDISNEEGPHGFMSFPHNFTLDTTTENIISPMAAYPSLNSADGSAADRDYKGIGGDIEVLSVLMDWGDAPDSYSTDIYTGNSGSGTDVRGPSHIITADGIYMGQSVDAEFNGVPSVGADGDDNASSPDDEDGISAFPPLLPGATSYTIPVANISAANSSGADVTIHAWIDFDGNGVFDADEYTSVTVANGATSPNGDLSWSGVGVSGVTGGRTYARFRITNDPNIDANTPGGRAANDEVEDYPIDVPHAMSIGSVVWEDLDGEGDQDASEPTIEGATVHLLMEDPANPGIYIDATHLDGSSVADITTLTDGKYYFDNLPEGKYKVQVSVAESYKPSPVQTGSNDDDSVGDSNVNTAAAGLPANTYESGVFTLFAGTEPTEVGGLTGDEQDDSNDANGNMTVDFGFVQPVSIGSFVWEDKNRNGLQESTEPKVQGAVVHLLVEDSANPGSYIAATQIGGGAVADITTDGTGTYYFGNLPAGNYKVQVTPPAGYLPTAQQTTSDDNGAAENDSNIAANPSANLYESSVITLTPQNEKQETDTQEGDNTDGASGSAEDLSGDMTVDFGFVKPVSMGSFVWEDKDRDGIQDNTEPKVQGAVVHLLVEDPVNPGTFIAAMHVDGSAVADITTGTDGKYFFDALPEGKYQVQVTAPAGFSKSPVQTTADDDDTENDSNIASTTGNVHTSAVFTLIAGSEPQETDTQEGDDSDGITGSVADKSGNMTVDFGLVQSVSIGSVVWEDKNKDGIQNVSEPKISGALVHLLVEDPNNPGTFIVATHEDGTEVIDITTDTTGEYLFDALPEGKYKVQVTPPVSYEPSPMQTATETDAEDDSNIASSPSAGVYESAVFTVSAGDEPVETDTFAGDTQDGVSGVQSDTSGNMTVDFGFVLKPVSIGSYVWDDKNKDGMQDASEPALAGATVHLLLEDPANPGTFVDAIDTTGTAVSDIVTGTDGVYFFDALPEGSYKVQVTPPIGYEPSPVQTTTATNVEGDSNIATSPSTGLYESAVFTLTAGTAPIESGTQTGDDADDTADSSGNMTVDFGFYSPVSIGSTVWFDSNNNGQMDGNEPGIAGVMVVLLDETGQIIENNITDINGNYFFGGLAEGNYTVTIPVPPTSAPRSSDVTGLNDNGIDNDDNGQQAHTGSTVTSPLIELKRNDENHAETGSGADLDNANDANGDMTVDFGFYNPVSVGSTVWFDSNNNGQLDNNESGIAGVRVVLLDNLGNPVDTNITDSHGNYFFNNLTEGNYTVTIPTPPANAPLSSTVTDSSDNSEDNDDNGIQTSIGTAVTSPVIELKAGTENDATEDLNYGGDMDDDIDQNGDMTVDFGFFDPLSIGSTVYYDEDNNGIQDGTETGIAGIEVQIFKAGDDPLTATPIDTRTTDSNGDYLFENLIEGQYFIYIPTAPQDAPLGSTTTVNVDT